MHSPKRKSALLIAGLLLAYFLGKANWRHPLIRLDSPLANHLVLALTLLAPVAALVLALRVLRATPGWQSAAASLVLAPLVLWGSVEGAAVAFDTVVSASELWHGRDLALQARSVLQVGATRVVAYRTNCGAACAFGIELRVERRVLPGLRLVRREGSWYPADDATLQRQATQDVLVIVEGRQRTEGPPTRLMLRVRPWVYF